MVIHLRQLLQLFRIAISHHEPRYSLGTLDAPDNPDYVKQFATNMKTFTNPINWNTTIYMPITRDLSAGKGPTLALVLTSKEH